jgi:hypothetical protein
MLTVVVYALRPPCNPCSPCASHINLGSGNGARCRSPRTVVRRNFYAERDNLVR